MKNTYSPSGQIEVVLLRVVHIQGVQIMTLPTWLLKRPSLEHFNVCTIVSQIPVMKI